MKSEPTPSTDTSDFVRATPRGRWLSAILVLLALALVAAFQYFAFPFLNRVLNGAPTPQSIIAIKSIFVGMAIIAVLAGVAMIQSGRKILRCKQSPPPDAWVWRDTRIKQGPAAIRLGWLCIVAGAVTGVLCIGLLAYLWIVFDRLGAQPNLRPGVIVLPPKTIRTP